MKEYPYMKNVVVLLYNYSQGSQGTSAPYTMTMLARPSVFIPLRLGDKKKSEPLSDLENLVRIILVWCGKQDLNLHEIAFTRT